MNEHSCILIQCLSDSPAALRAEPDGALASPGAHALEGLQSMVGAQGEIVPNETRVNAGIKHFSACIGRIHDSILHLE